MPKNLRRVLIAGSKARAGIFLTLQYLLLRKKVIHTSPQITGTLKKIEILDTGEIYYHVEPIPPSTSKIQIITDDIKDTPMIPSADVNR